VPLPVVAGNLLSAVLEQGMETTLAPVAAAVAPVAAAVGATGGTAASGGGSGAVGEGTGCGGGAGGGLTNATWAQQALVGLWQGVSSTVDDMRFRMSLRCNSDGVGHIEVRPTPSQNSDSDDDEGDEVLTSPAHFTVADGSPHMRFIVTKLPLHGGSGGSGGAERSSARSARTRRRGSDSSGDDSDGSYSSSNSDGSASSCDDADELLPMTSICRFESDTQLTVVLVIQEPGSANIPTSFETVPPNDAGSALFATVVLDRVGPPPPSLPPPTPAGAGASTTTAATVATNAQPDLSKIVSEVRLRTSAMIEQVVFAFADGSSKQYGSSTGSADPPAALTPNEYINRVQWNGGDGHRGRALWLGTSAGRELVAFGDRAEGTWQVDVAADAGQAVVGFKWDCPDGESHATLVGCEFATAPAALAPTVVAMEDPLGGFSRYDPLVAGMSVERRAATVQALCTELATELSAAAAADAEDHFVGVVQQRAAAVRAAVRGAQSPLIKVVGAEGPLAAVVNGFFAAATVANGGKVKSATADEPLVYRMLGPRPAVDAEPAFLYYTDARECWVLGTCHSRPSAWGLGCH
jgi:hypothetical protein